MPQQLGSSMNACQGQRKPTPLAIEGGQETSGYEGVVLIYSVRSADNNSFKCSGTIVGHNVVLTAAHCIKGPAESTHVIEADFLRSPEEVRSALQRSVKPHTILRHPDPVDWTKARMDQAAIDLAVLIFRDHTFPGRGILVPSLSGVERPEERAETIMVGFGGSSADDSTNTTTAVKRAGRGFYYPFPSPAVLITSDQMLAPGTGQATGPKSFSRAHQGDSGGPLLHKKNDVLHIVGVASMVSLQPDSKLGSYAVYADLHGSKSLNLLRQAISKGASFSEPENSQQAPAATGGNLSGCAQTS